MLDRCPDTVGCAAAIRAGDEDSKFDLNEDNAVDQLLLGHDLGQRGLEPVVDHRAGVELPVLEHLQDGLGDLARMGELRRRQALDASLREAFGVFGPPGESTTRTR